jgi:hypothetical protein
MNRKDTTENKIDQLSTILNDLKITQGIINQQLQQAEHTINELKTSLNIKEDNNNNTTNDKVSSGDRVKILNPRGKQSNYGTVDGYTRTGFIRIIGDNGDTIRRKPSNIEIVTP